MTFDTFDLDPRLLEVIHAQGITQPTPIQVQAIPVIAEGSDVVGIAQTGTGKTLAFGLSALNRLANNKRKGTTILVLVPTRELCVQVHSVLQPLAKAVGVKATTVYGGVGIKTQADLLQAGTDVIVATPGRLLDHLERRNANLRDLEILILDEADRMLDMGFWPDIQRIVSMLPKKRQTLLFSATFAPEIERMANNIQRDPVQVRIGLTSKPVESVRQSLYPVHSQKKLRLLLDIIEEEEPGPTLIFLRTKDRTEMLGQALQRKGHNVTLIHGDRTQIQREEALKGFRSGKYDVLVATDVAARGLDIEGVSHVINYDIPLTPDDYIHRIGRTARAKSEGDAITLVSPDEFQYLGNIERALGHNIPRVETEDSPSVISVYKPGGAQRGRTGRRMTRKGGRRR